MDQTTKNLLKEFDNLEFVFGKYFITIKLSLYQYYTYEVKQEQF